jgi:Zn-finger nucleic acid-binding protein
MHCPRCKAVLVGDEYEGVEVERCPGCHGFWIPGSRLADIIEKREKAFSLEDKPIPRPFVPSAGRTCSRTDTPMRRRY